MTRLGMIARCDDGGLGTITREVFRHLRPDRTLVVRLGDKGRGVERLERFTVQEGTPDRRVRACPYPVPTGAVDWLLDGIDVLYTAETPYHPALPWHAADRDVRVVLHAMPELFDKDYVGPTTEVWTPTGWSVTGVRDKVGEAYRGVLPVPVALDRLTENEGVFRERRFGFIGAPAMLDRAGHDIARAAWAEFATVNNTRDNVRVSMRHVDGGLVDYWQATEDIDVLVAPRRYGGLSLPVQEAAGRGVPSIVLNSDWYAREAFTLNAPACGSTLHAMKGGMFQVMDAHPGDLAMAMAAFLDSDYWAGKSSCAMAWAQANSWEALLPQWREVLGNE